MMAELPKIAEEAITKIDSKLECSICLDNFKEPKLLPCFHIFCKSPCLEKLVVQANEGQTLNCPTCRYLVPLPVNGVGGLQTDFHIEHLFEIRESLQKAKNTKCENCTDKNATKYCRECSVFVCDDCTQAHNAWKKNSGHQILGINEVEADAVGKVAPTEQPVKCEKHSDMEARIYCETCSKLICNDCTIRLHRNHDYDLARDVYKKHKKEIFKSVKQLKTKLYKVGSALGIFETRRQDMYHQRDTVEADIHKEIDQLHQFLDKRRAELVARLYMLSQQKLEELAMQRSYVEMAEAKMSSCFEYATAALDTGTVGVVLRMRTPLLNRIEAITAEFELDKIHPQSQADIELVAANEDLQQACGEFGEVACHSVIPKKVSAKRDLQQACPELGNVACYPAIPTKRSAKKDLQKARPEQEKVACHPKKRYGPEDRRIHVHAAAAVVRAHQMKIGAFVGAVTGWDKFLKKYFDRRVLKKGAVFWHVYILYNVMLDHLLCLITIYNVMLDHYIQCYA